MRILQIIILALSFPVYAFEAFEVSDIRVEGLQRISPGTVFNFLPVQVGDYLTEHESELTIRSLYKSGYFRDIKLERDENVLVVIVQERPAIAPSVWGHFYTELSSHGLRWLVVVHHILSILQKGLLLSFPLVLLLLQ